MSSRIALLATLAALAPVAPLALGACLPPPPPVPLDRPIFPKGLVVTRDGNHLLVVSSDYLQEFDQGALLSADLGAVRAAAAAAQNGAVPVVRSAYTHAVELPPFGDRPVLSPLGDRVYVPLMNANRVASVDVAADGALTCGAAGKPEVCGDTPRALQLAKDDPFTVIPLSEDANGTRVTGLVANLSSSIVTFFADDSSRAGAGRVTQTGTLDLGADTVAGVRSAVLRPAQNGSPAVVIAGADVGSTTTTTTTDPLTGIATQTSVIGAQLLVFQPKSNSDIRGFDVTNTTGALSMRDMVLVPGRDGAPNGAVVAALQPVGLSCCDAMARFEIVDDGALPSLKLAALEPTCKGPTSLAYARAPVDGVVVTCFDDDTVEVVDPVTLAPTAAVRFAGRGPYGVAVRDDAALPEAYISFFEDDSVGLMTLVNAAGAPSLAMQARIGEQKPKPEDGRE